MQYIDHFLTNALLDPDFPKDKLLSKDRSILESFVDQLARGVFFTERQGKLLISILNNNKRTILGYHGTADILKTPLWSREFRVIEQYRIIQMDPKSSSHFNIKFNADRVLRNEVLSVASHYITGSTTDSNNFKLILNEESVYEVIRSLAKFNFVVDEKLKDFYREIVKIKNSDNEYFDVFKLTDKNLIAAIHNDIGDINTDNLLMLHDRKHKFQYQVTTPLPRDDLTSRIAARECTKIFTNNSTVQLSDIISSLVKLDRFPLMVVFSSFDEKQSSKELSLLCEVLSEYNLLSDVGVYHRFQNSEYSKFNETIHNHKLNKHLTKDTKIVGITNSRLPKILLSTGWEPKSVISFSGSLRTNKAAMFCESCDLIVYYTDTLPFAVCEEI